jgi:hypothetical protein
VQRLLASTETNRKADIRYRPILLLLAIYGLRVGEVQRIRLEDINWEQKTITITATKQRRCTHWQSRSRKTRCRPTKMRPTRVPEASLILIPPSGAKYRDLLSFEELITNRIADVLYFPADRTYFHLRALAKYLRLHRELSLRRS